ncbi:MAG: Uncharacterized protein G01um10147_1044 [Microgenomates group bacterium Gr01-1014_7]|nr:MAG: Uncharacterized protein G01um10147_1044 [Microgenomates group bacterium Gr01-1014_7]
MDLSIIILSYNTKEITNECLKRLQAKNKKNIEVIVLDNASSDGSVEMIKKNYPWVNLIVSKENTGFSKGNNIAFKKSKYPVVLFMNSDVYVEDDTLEKALGYFENRVEVMGPGMVFEDGSFQPSAGELPTPLNTILWIFGLGGFHPKKKSYFEKMRQVGWITGAFFMIKREVYERVGGFDENIFMYLEEVELCKRITLAGFKIWYVPEIIVTHLHGASSKFDRSPALSKELQGLKYYFQKYYKEIYPVVKLFLILGLIMRIVAFSLLGKTKRAKVYMEGLAVV